MQSFIFQFTSLLLLFSLQNGRAQWIPATKPSTQSTTPSPSTTTPPVTSPTTRSGRLLCENGWDDGAGKDDCYYYNTTVPLSWEDARKSCRGLGADLLSLADKNEMAYINAKIKNTAWSTSGVWTGGNDFAVDMGWAWSDNKPFPLFNWAHGQPVIDNVADCIFINKTSGEWYTIDCRSKFSFVCKKQGIQTWIPPSTPSPPTTPSSVPNGTYWGCHEGWRGYMDSCYSLFEPDQPVSWSQARNVCKQNGSSLVSIGSNGENSFVFSLLSEGSRAWIGLYAKKTDTSFSWSEGPAKVTYTLWDVDKPSHVAASDDACVVFVDNGRWSDEKCVSLEKSFVCQKRKEIVDFDENFGCPKESLAYHEKCYMLRPKLKQHRRYSFQCMEHGGEEASITNRFEQAFLTSTIDTHPGDEPFVIGLQRFQWSDVKTVGQYIWTSGDPITYTNWDPNHTGKLENTCVVMVKGTGFWRDAKCLWQKHYPFICQIQRHNYTTIPPPAVTTPSTLPPCPGGWTELGSKCYFFSMLQGVQKLSWHEAFKDCKRRGYGSNLVSILDLKTDYSLIHLSINGDNKNVMNFTWIGLTKRDRNQGYEWVNNDPFIFQRWGINQPNDTNTRYKCVEFEDHGYWRNADCYKKNNYICQIDKASLITASTQTTTTTTPGTSVKTTKAASTTSTTMTTTTTAKPTLASLWSNLLKTTISMYRRQARAGIQATFCHSIFKSSYESVDCCQITYYMECMKRAKAFVGSMTTTDATDWQKLTSISFSITDYKCGDRTTISSSCFTDPLSHDCAKVKRQETCSGSVTIPKNSARATCLKQIYMNDIAIGKTKLECQNQSPSKDLSLRRKLYGAIAKFPLHTKRRNMMDYVFSLLTLSSNIKTLCGKFTEFLKDLNIVKEDAKKYQVFDSVQWAELKTLQEDLKKERCPDTS